MKLRVLILLEIGADAENGPHFTPMHETLVLRKIGMACAGRQFTLERN